MYTQQEKKNPVIVYGTTPDYVKKIFQRSPDKVFFIIDRQFRDDPFLCDVGKDLLLFIDIEDCQGSIKTILQHFKERDLTPVGMACYDCESLFSASELVHELNIDFPSRNSVRLARNKVISKQLWRKANISCPNAIIASNQEETLTFYGELNNEIVLKPVSSSGSELVFHCRNKQEVIESVGTMASQLKARRHNPFYRRIYNDSLDPCKSWVVEEYISGPEFSCDFILQDGRLTILRMSGKVKDREQSFGSILAYLIPPIFPDGLSYSSLKSLFKKAVTSLGFNKGFFMADFIVHEGVPYIIEVSPRPGGDSIPYLIGIATGIDILGLHLDFVSGRLKNPDYIPAPNKQYASINLYAPKEGIISEIDAAEIYRLPWVKGVFIKRKVNDRVILPPDDYESRKIGYVIAAIEPSWNLVKTRQILQQNLQLSIIDHPPSWAKVPENKFQVFMVAGNETNQEHKTT
ncbi:ATP-grasp domain-containing protein [Thermodesulfobacteriota bacterium]